MVMNRGTLVLVVGPSGAGKDSVIDGARARFANDPSITFPARVVTRPADAGGERHAPVSEADFGRMAAAGAFALWWRAHGLGYGIPRSIEDHLADGRCVVVNVSREAVNEAQRRYAPVKVVVVTAPAAILARRLAARGRESAAEIEERLSCAPETVPAGPGVEIIDNSGDLREAVRRFVDILRRVAAEEGAR
jgi:phosphonate metabolism protein PhnN/1,5-bisphosphokinase (PRPP-forming)